MTEAQIRRLHRIRGEQEVLLNEIKGVRLSDGMDPEEIAAVTRLELRILALVSEALSLMHGGDPAAPAS